MGLSLLSTTKTWRPRCGDLDQDRLAETAHGAPVAAGMEERLSEEQAAKERLEEQLLEEQALEERLKEQLLEQQAVKQHTTGRLEEQFWTLVSTMAPPLVSTIAL